MTTHLRQVWDRGETALEAFLYVREPLIVEAVGGRSRMPVTVGFDLGNVMNGLRA